MSRRVFWGIGIVAVAVGAIVAIGLISTARTAPPAALEAVESSAPALPTPTVPPTPAPTPASTDPAGTAGADATDLTVPFIAAESAARATPDQPVSFEEVATGEALRELQITALEFAENGLMQVGAPVVVSATFTAVDETVVPATATVTVCLDYAGVDVVAPDGTSVKSADAAQRVPTVLTLVQMDGRWLVSQRGFPEDPTC